MVTAEQFATKIRLKTCEMLRHVGFGHLGAALSIVETLAVLYSEMMHIDPKNPESMDRDWFVLSKGHGGPSYYATLALRGYFDESELFTLNQNETTLPSHPDRLKVKGVDVTTGSLGQGISQAVGVAKGLQIQDIDRKVYCVIGDGECNEGQVWEAVQFAVSQNLDNFYLFVDDNKKQLDGFREAISLRANFKELFEAFGFDTRTVNGGSTEAIKAAIIGAQQVLGKPHCIVLDTIKAQGIPYFETMADNHHIRFTAEDLAELDKAIDRMRRGLEHGNA